MNQWWQNLESRERTLISVMAFVVSFALIFSLLLDPLFSGSKEYKERVSQAEEDLAWMKQLAPRLSSIGPGTVRSSGDGTLISIVDETTKRQNLTIRGNQKMGEDKLRVQFDKSSFESLVLWFGDLHQRQVAIDTVSLTRDDEKVGTTNATIVIKKAVN